MKVDIIVPTYKPDDTFCLLLQKLQEQTFVVHRLILMNTEEHLWEEARAKYPIDECLSKLTCAHLLIHVSKEEFDHGGTRNLGAEHSEADVIMFMTQDAVPADPYLVERLVETFGETAREGALRERAPEVTAEDKAVAVAYARQLPNMDCGIVERYTRGFNYPDISQRKSRADLKKLGIKTFFCSDVCAAYRRDLFVKLGGFESPVIFNEDMFFAAKAIEAGYTVAYAADAAVVHSHNYSVKQQFHRNFDLAVSQADHPEIFAQVSSEAEGMKLVKSTVKYLCSIKKPYLIWGLGWQCVGKYAGYYMGKRYKKLSRRRILKYTMNPDYWKKIWKDTDGTAR